MYNNLKCRTLTQRLCRLPHCSRACLLSTTGQKYESSKDYQYLEQSKIPTMHFQKSLPRLPIPELAKTCERYLASQQPLLSPEEFADTSKNVKEFEVGIGKELNDRLIAQDKANSHTSYISQPWFDMYLKDRVPLLLNYNPSIVFLDSPPSLNTQLIRATNFVVSSLRFLKALRSDCLAPEVYHLNPKKSDTALFRNVCRALPQFCSWYGAYLFKAYPLDMSQYGNLFNSTRIPKQDRDQIVKDESGRHLLVMRRGRYYKFDVIDKKGDILPPADILEGFRHILSQNHPTIKETVGLLTAGRRDTWASQREHLASLSDENVSTLRDIDSAIFCLCLEDDVVGQEPANISRYSLHGDGTNRWYDKSLSLIISADGNAAVNFEHSWGDGVAILRYFQEIWNDSNKHVFVDSENIQSSSFNRDLIKEIGFTLDDRLREDITKARITYDATCNSLDMNFFEAPSFGKVHCKSAKISPDAVMQLAFQVAYHKAFGKFVGTYESCSTAAFKHGRTETVRPCTTATKDFALAFNSNNRPSSQDLITMMQKCSVVHSELTKNAAMGQGFDRHLFALRSLASQGGKMPSIFTDPAYAKLNTIIISTSTLGTPIVKGGAFGPVASNGLGVAYNVLDNYCGAAVSSYRQQADGAAFVSALTETVTQFSKLLGSKKQ